MLEPRDRTLLFDALRPPDGFHFDQGIGTTYTLDLIALMMAPLAFTFFAQTDEAEPAAALDSLELLESLRRHADRLTIFAQAGRIALPKNFYPQLAFLEDSVVECQPARGVFHPKVWLLRFVGRDREIHYRVLCLTRNLGFARAWDTLLALDGVYDSERKANVAANRGLIDFVRALPRLALRPEPAARVGERIEEIASELQRTQFGLPDGFESIRFWPLGVAERNDNPFESAGERLLIVSPFVTVGQLERLSKGRREVVVVSSAIELERLARRPSNVTRFYTLADRAMPEPEGEQQTEAGTEAEAIQQSDLHAKLYVSESGSDAYVWTGSANATTAGFGGNVELLVELTGPRKRFGIDALMTPEAGELRFVDLLTEATAIGSKPQAAAIEELEKTLDQWRTVFATVRLEARVTARDSETYDIELFCSLREAARVETGISVLCWPATASTGVAAHVDVLMPAEPIARFAGVTFSALTSFFAFELSGRAAGEERRVRFVLNVPLVGAPEGRRERVLRSLVRDRSKMLRFLLLLLADEGVANPMDPGLFKTDAARDADDASDAMASGLFEMLLRNLDRAPHRLDHLHSLLHEFRRGEDGEDLLPAGFDEIWAPIWRRRERLRARTAR